MKQRAFLTSRDAATGIFSFLIAGVLLVGFVATALQVTSDAGTSTSSQSASLNTQAQGLLSILLDSPGSAVGGADWIAQDETGYLSGPDAVTRLGLADPGRPGYANFSKLHNLAFAPWGIDDDGHVSYSEARQGILSQEDLEFHLRAYPTLRSVQEILDKGYRDQNMRVAYIGDVDELKGDKSDDQDEETGPTPISLGIQGLACSTGPTPDTVKVTYAFTNTGSTTTHFGSLLTLHGHEDELNHPILAPGESTQVEAVLPTGSHKWCEKGTVITVAVWDPSSLIDQASVALGSDVAGVSSHGGEVEVATEYPFYLEGESIRVYWSGSAIKNNDGLRIQVYEGIDGSGEKTYDSGSFTPGNANQHPWYRTIGPLDAGVYRVTLEHGGAQTHDLIVVAAAPLDDYVIAGEDDAADEAEGPFDTAGGFTPAASLGSEVAMIESLVENFCALYHDGTAVAGVSASSVRCNFLDSSPAEGSVFPDLKDVMNNDLAAILESGGKPRYDVVNTLIVGSNVDHSAMTSQAAKGRIEAWVLGGGNLIVLGSSAQSLQWLQPLFHAGTQTSNGELYAPDATHPILTTSEMLDWDAYSNHGRAWKYSAGADEFFTTVVQEGDEDVTAVSKTGAFEKGTIILTTWRPFDIYGDGSDDGTEGTRLLNNLLTYGYVGLYLDYGPPIPDGVETVPSYRVVNVDHPQLGPVQVSFVLFVWDA